MKLKSDIQIFIDMDLDVFGNKVILDERDGRAEFLIVKNFDYPQCDELSMKLFRFIEHINIEDSGLEFPIRIIQKSITIFPTDENTIRKYFSFDGIHKFIEEQQLQGNQFFIKPELFFLNDSGYLTIHFFFVSKNHIGERMRSGFDLIDRCTIYYETHNQFTEDRLLDLAILVDAKEVMLIPCLPLTYVQYDDIGKLKNLRFDTYWTNN